MRLRPTAGGPALTVVRSPIIAEEIAGQTISSSCSPPCCAAKPAGAGERVEVPAFDAGLAFKLVEHLSRPATRGGSAGCSRIMITTSGPHQELDMSDQGQASPRTRR